MQKHEILSCFRFFALLYFEAKKANLRHGVNHLPELSYFWQYKYTCNIFIHRYDGVLADDRWIWERKRKTNEKKRTSPYFYVQNVYHLKIDIWKYQNEFVEICQ